MTSDFSAKRARIPTPHIRFGFLIIIFLLFQFVPRVRTAMAVNGNGKEHYFTMTNSRPSRTSLAEEAAGGLSAGIIGTVLGFPLDLIKTRMQTQSVSAGILSTGRSVVHKEGFLALYKGIAPPLISLSILNTVTFASYSYLQSLLHATRGWDGRNALAGSFCGIAAGTVSTVENLVKTQMQLDNTRIGRQSQQFRGSWDCVRQLTASHGGTVLYTGHAVNTIRESVFLSTYFFVYEGFRQQLIGSGNNAGDNKWAIPVAGGCAGAIAWTVSFPLDCVRAGVQGQDFAAGGGIRRGAWRVFTDLLQQKGVRGLYSGVAPSLIRAFLVSGSRFSAYEGALWLLRGGRDAPGRDERVPL
jgi:solute carrier family 25 carnitine/acylcarnitine transporter 20/29